MKHDVERSDFSIATLAPWDFWTKTDQVVIPPNTSPDTAAQIVIMRAIALRDLPAPSERRN